MSRARGQIDQKKAEAILAAAAEVFAERGFGAPLDEVARRAGVSKQTVYNQFGSKEELLRAAVSQRCGLITAALDAPGATDRLEDTLAAYARNLTAMFLSKERRQVMRMAIVAGGDFPQAAEIVYQAGPFAARKRLAEFLAGEAERGHLDIDNPIEAAEFFGGMASGHIQLRGLFDLPRDYDDAALDRRARECARRFMKMYSPPHP
jgi:TetR/AcrR family transcriptional repressor of mexJK operon